VWKIVERQDELAEICDQYPSLFPEELWFRCIGLGGTNTPLQMDAIVHGALRPNAHEFNLIAVAINEYLEEIGVNRVVEYIEERSGIR
jgi:hypothetical protein